MYRLRIHFFHRISASISGSITQFEAIGMLCVEPFILSSNNIQLYAPYQQERYLLMHRDSPPFSRGCYSTSVGKSLHGGEQQISIGKGCNYIGTVIHEMMHAVGFFHEHTRLDRDQYVTIYWNSIQKGNLKNFL